VIIDGKKLATTLFPEHAYHQRAKYVRLQNLVFRNLKNTNGYASCHGRSECRDHNCAFDSLRWTTTSAEYGYPTINNTSYFYKCHLRDGQRNGNGHHGYPA